MAFMSARYRLNMRLVLSTIALVCVSSLLGVCLFRSSSRAPRRVVVSANDWREARLSFLHARLKDFVNTNNTYPPAVVRSPTGEACQGWRALLYWATQDVQRKHVDPSRCWDDEYNRNGACHSLSWFCNPEESPSSATAFVAVVEEGFIFDPNHTTSQEQLQVAQTNPLLVVHSANSEIPWAAPRDFSFEDFWRRYQARCVSNDPRGFLAIRHDDEPRWDTSVWLIPYGMNKDHLRRLFTIDGK